ncbi:sigma-70 family RNA polymerase sigma factor [Carboxylicivirga sediminis]|uniref:Sigma-70 family RNA polymerase sigma factor n=1 Tax=Carboxylicivirga sediminis TaxID=2006564 RepID=A0A941F3Q6_9BACT|nr:sigma-70 family RNA polymerase sigma factor [Carboxylicivirga sediminis]MBR8535809.1 sigma-70 family RNA polymerase sigma factor [Carboxylicivirga sediminis]
MKLAGKQIDYNSSLFKDIFERLFPSMCLLAARILKDDDVAKDIVQEAFVKLWQKDNEDFTDENTLRAYLYVLVKNACISQLRKEKHKTNASIDEGLTIGDQEFLNEILREETYQLLREAINELSPKASKVVHLSLKGYSNQEIADELDVTINTIKTVKKRAYKALKERLGAEYIIILLTQFINFF